MQENLEALESNFEMINEQIESVYSDLSSLGDTIQLMYQQHSLLAFHNKIKDKMTAAIVAAHHHYNIINNIMLLDDIGYPTPQILSQENIEDISQELEIEMQNNYKAMKINVIREKSNIIVRLQVK